MVYMSEQTLDEKITQDDSVDRDAVLNALSRIIDPDLHHDIVTLGFVKKVRICDGNVAFTLELTTPACPVKDEMEAKAHKVVSELPGVKAVNIKMTAQTRRPPEIKNLIPGIKNAIAVASGKGGVGKSTTSVNLALALASTGAKVGLMDADIYGPSIPIMMGIPAGIQPEGSEENGVQRIYPLEQYGISLISIGFLTDKNQAIVWRGPMVGKMIKTFLGSVVWGDLDYLIIDLPPGTGDIQLTLMQNAPLTGAVVVTTPESVALEDVTRCGNMFSKMKQAGIQVPILGVVENMSWYETPSGEKIELFGSGAGQRAADFFRVPLLGQVPRILDITTAGDTGKPAVASDPDGAAAQVYRDIAGNLARHISTLSLQKKPDPKKVASSARQNRAPVPA